MMAISSEQGKHSPHLVGRCETHPWPIPAAVVDVVREGERNVHVLDEAVGKKRERDRDRDRDRERERERERESSVCVRVCVCACVT